MEEKLTIREACRQRHPLDGADAQAIEGALCQLERENAKLRKMYDDTKLQIEVLKSDLAFVNHNLRNPKMDGSHTAVCLMRTEKYRYEPIKSDKTNDSCPEGCGPSCPVHVPPLDSDDK